MGRSQETFNKKEVKNKKEKKRKDKAKKKLIKKETGKKNSFDDMIAYVDEYGKISSTPPDPNKKILVEANGIELSATKNEPAQKSDYIRKGVVTFFNESKGFGFIRDMDNNQSVFVHANNLQEIIKENNIVSFEIGKGPKGPTALKVKLFKD
ncbi:MAG: cold shock domain-containing protein [Bacteroidales bacterium]|nr:cold shock domain-containing protein [Bacteroidales bacterium]